MSTLFEVSVVAMSSNDDIDLESIVDQPASLRLVSGIHGARRWSGVCSLMEQEQTEETGLSSYHLRIVPPSARSARSSPASNPPSPATGAPRSILL